MRLLKPRTVLLVVLNNVIMPFSLYNEYLCSNLFEYLKSLLPFRDIVPKLLQIEYLILILRERLIIQR